MELLVVIAIISLLAALLLPSLKSARESARKAYCISNQRQIHLGLMMYANDYDGWGPGYISHLTGSRLSWPTNWANAYWPVPKIFRCPSNDPKLDRTDVSPKAPPGTRIGDRLLYASYRIFFGQGTVLPGTSPYYFYGWYQLNNASPANDWRSPCPNLRFLGHSLQTGSDTSYCAPPDQQGAVFDVFNIAGYDWVVWPGPNSYARNNHDGGENITFMDGHVEWRDLLEVRWRFHAASGYVDFYW